MNKHPVFILRTIPSGIWIATSAVLPIKIADHSVSSDSDDVTRGQLGVSPQRPAGTCRGGEGSAELGGQLERHHRSSVSASPEREGQVTAHFRPPAEGSADR